MSFIRTCVDRPVLTTVMVGVLIVFGVFSFTQLARELTPEVEFPFIIVTTIYPGAGPKEVESQLTEKLEDEVGSVAGLKRMESQSLESLSLIVLEFELGVDADLAAIEVKDKVDLAMINLPDEVEPPVVQQYSFDSFPVLNVAVYSARPLAEITTLADARLKDAVSRVNGVSKVELIGGLEREIHIACRADRLRSFGLSILDVVGLIQAENFNFPTGRIIGRSGEYSLRMVGELDDLFRLRALRLPTPSGARVRLDDIADVIDTYEEPREQARYQGQPAVSLAVMKKSDSNTVAVSEGVHAAVGKLAPWLAQETLNAEIINDQAKYIRDSVSDAANNILIGIVLTSILLYLFLHDYRQTFVVATVMPGSVLATFTLMYAADFSLNIISLMALGISVGTIVTNSIVVLENITRKLHDGLSSRDAAIEGTSEVAVAVGASTLTNIVVFTPIAFMKGIIGQFFYEFGLTVVFATLVSLLISFTLVPMLSKFVLAKPKGHLVDHHGKLTLLERFAKAWDAFYDELSGDYAGALRAGLRRRWIVAVVSLLSFIGGCGLLSQVGSEFFPEGDEGIFRIVAKLPAGTSLAKTDETLQAIEARLTGIPEIKSLLSEIGGQGKGVEDGTVAVQLVDFELRDRSVQAVMDEVRPRLADIPAAELQLVLGDGGGGPGQGIQIEVTGAELDKVNALADEVLEIARRVPGVIDLRSTYVSGKPELSFLPDRAQLSTYGVTSQEVAYALRTGFEGQESTYFREGGEDYDLRVLLDESERESLTSYADMLIRTPSGFVPLSQLGEVRYTSAETKIERKNKLRFIKVEGNVSGITAGEGVELIKAEMKKAELRVPEGYDVFFGGQAESMAEEFGYIFQALILAIILTYLVLAAILEDFVHPFTIMLTLPLGMIGVAMALFIGGVSINMMSLMGIVMLVGIVVNNAILILDYVKQLRERGMGLIEALVESSSTRLRPIIMMNMAIALSVFPQALGGAGAEFRRALAVVTMGGVLISAIFTLFLIPVIYTVFDRIAIQPKVRAESAPKP